MRPHDFSVTFFQDQLKIAAFEALQRAKDRAYYNAPLLERGLSYVHLRHAARFPHTGKIIIYGNAVTSDGDNFFSRHLMFLAEKRKDQETVPVTSIFVDWVDNFRFRTPGIGYGYELTFHDQQGEHIAFLASKPNGESSINGIMLDNLLIDRNEADRSITLHTIMKYDKPRRPVRVPDFFAKQERDVTL